MPVRGADDSQPPHYDEIIALEGHVQSEDKSSYRSHDQPKLLAEELAQAREQIQQLESQMSKQNADHLAEINKLFRDFHSEKQDLIGQLRQSQKDRDDLARELDEVRSKMPTAAANGVASSSTSTRKPNPSLNVLDSQGGFPLYGAAAGGHYAEVERMLAEGADPSMRTRFKWTALHWAAGNGHAAVVGLLLSHGADVNAVSDTRQKPLGMAKTDEIKAMLLQKGATV